MKSCETLPEGYFATVKFSGFPKDILIQDHGVGMTVYTKETL